MNPKYIIEKIPPFVEKNVQFNEKSRKHLQKQCIFISEARTSKHPQKFQSQVSIEKLTDNYRNQNQEKQKTNYPTKNRAQENKQNPNT